MQDSDDSDLEDNKDTTLEIFPVFDSEGEKEMEQSLEDIGKVPEVPSEADKSDEHMDVEMSDFCPTIDETVSFMVPNEFRLFL